MVLAHSAVLVQDQVVAVGGLGQNDAYCVAYEEDFWQLDLIEAVDSINGLVEQEKTSTHIRRSLIAP
jgi:hypothetical protein